MCSNIVVSQVICCQVAFQRCLTGSEEVTRHLLTTCFNPVNLHHYATKTLCLHSLVLSSGGMIFAMAMACEHHFFLLLLLTRWCVECIWDTRSPRGSSIVLLRSSWLLSPLSSPPPCLLGCHQQACWLFWVQLANSQWCGVGGMPPFTFVNERLCSLTYVTCYPRRQRERCARRAKGGQAVSFYKQGKKRISLIM